MAAYVLSQPQFQGPQLRRLRRYAGHAFLRQKARCPKGLPQDLLRNNLAQQRWRNSGWLWSGFYYSTQGQAVPLNLNVQDAAPPDCDECVESRSRPSYATKRQ